MGAISFLFNRFLTFGTFKGIWSNDKCDMYFKAEDSVIHMHIYGAYGEDYYHQVFECRSCNLGESFDMRASLKNISFKNITLTVLDKVIENVFIINKEEYNINKINAHRLSKKIPLKMCCEICSSENRLQRHHPDYSKPLEVITLCNRCHKNLHKKVRKEIGGEIQCDTIQ
jgi:hypothetical protein